MRKVVGGLIQMSNPLNDATAPVINSSGGDIRPVNSPLLIVTCSRSGTSSVWALK